MFAAGAHLIGAANGGISQLLVVQFEWNDLGQLSADQNPGPVNPC